MLTAKFGVPRPPPTDIRRGHLLAALRESGTPVVLISAPAGWGKTRMAGQLAADVSAGGDVVIWLTADAFDDDTELWADLFAAARHALPGFGDGPPAAGRAGGSTVGYPHPGPAVDRWLDAVDRLARPVTLVLDDLQQITDRAAMSGLARMVALAPPTLRVVFATRHDPALPIARWRMEGRLTELRAADLAARVDEAAALLAALGVPLEPDDVALLVRRTEGWIGGIRLAGQLLVAVPDRSATIRALTGGSGAGSLARYLIEQVVEDLEPDDRAFLRDVSVLTTVPVDLAGTLTGRSDALAVLRRLVTRTGFVAPVDDTERSFRCHHLLSAALRYELEGTGVDRMRELLSAASQWYADRDRPVDAVRCAVRAADWPLARDQLERASTRLIVQGRSALVLQLLSAFPRPVVLADPELAGVELAARMWTGDRTDQEPLLATVRGGLPDLRRRHPARAGVLAYKLAMAAAAAARIDGHFDRMRDETTTAATSLQSGGAMPELAARRLVLTGNLGTAALWLGDLPAAASLLTQVIGYAGEPSLPRLNCLSLVGWVDLVQGRLTAAAAAADLAIATAERHGWTNAYQLASAFICRAMVGVERFDLDAADADLDRARRSWEPIRELAVGLTMGLVRSRILTARGRPDQAIAALAALRADHRTRPTTEFLERLVRWSEAEAAAAGDDWCAVNRLAADLSSNRVAETVFAARRAVVHGDHQLARRLLTDPDRRPGLGRDLGVHIRRQLLLSRAFQAAGRRTEAITALRTALDVAGAEGFRLPFIELGGHGRPLLRMLLTADDGPRADLAAEVLALLPADLSPSIPAQRRPDFTPREQDLITVLPTRMSNEAIARLLNVSPNTIKTHLRSVYRKLGVDDRDAAVEQAGRLGLL